MDFFQLAGRFHPLILHLPIGILAMAFLMLLLERSGRKQGLEGAITLSLQFGMWSALLAAGSGFILSYEGGYDEDLLFKHQWAGIATALFAVLVHVLYQRRKSSGVGKFHFPVFVCLMLLIGTTGHWGGSLTHGSAFLTEPLQAEKELKRVQITDINQAVIFTDIIQPILDNKCVSCHNPGKMKGGLLMSSLAGLKKGGKHGAFQKSGDADNSLFLQRAHLPLEEEEHMPPKGKKQLSSDEITLLEWWVNQGASFTKKVEETEQSESVENILKDYAKNASGVMSIDLAFADEKLISKLKSRGAKIEPLLEDKAFLSVSLRGKQDLDAALMKDLSGIAEQVIILDLSNSNLTDDLFARLQGFKNIQKLFLQKTELKGENLNAWADKDYLEYLNLYSTAIDDEGIKSLQSFSNLKRLFLWDTNASKTAVADLQKQKPQLTINTGIDTSVFGKGALKAPLIEAEKNLFRDSLKVEVVYNFKGVNIYYTLDGTMPDSTSLLYRQPLILDKTTEVKVSASKEGWLSSPVAERNFVKVGQIPQQVRVLPEPNEKYQAKGAASLINLQQGTTDFSGGEWLGYQGKHFTAEMDFGEAQQISKVSLSALEDTRSYIFFPKKVEVYASQDGKSYSLVGTKDIAVSREPAPPETRLFTVDCTPVSAAYLRVEVKSNLKNPAWHPASGAPCWVFTDEILVE